MSIESSSLTFPSYQVPPRTRATRSGYFDLVESGGGMWKISSIPAIKYCLDAGLKLRRMAGVSGGSILAGSLGAGVTLPEIVEMLPRIQNVGFLDAFQVPTLMRKAFPKQLLINNTVGRLPKQRDRRLAEVQSELALVCAHINVSGSIIDVLNRVGQSLRGTTFRRLLHATVEFTSFLRGLHVQEVMERAVEGAELVILSSRLTPEVSIAEAIGTSCAFFISRRINGQDLYDGFYFSNLPTRVVVRKSQRQATVLAHQTNPFVGNTWTNWLLRRIFNARAIELLLARWAEDERLAKRFGVLLHPQVQEIASPFSAASSHALLEAGRAALAEHQIDIDHRLLKSITNENKNS
ncbi:MAG: patatin-like phospholipase family protein [Acidobacteriota bacterium]